MTYPQQQLDTDSYNIDLLRVSEIAKTCIGYRVGFESVYIILTSHVRMRIYPTIIVGVDPFIAIFFAGGTERWEHYSVG